MSGTFSRSSPKNPVSTGPGETTETEIRRSRSSCRIAFENAHDLRECSERRLPRRNRHRGLGDALLCFDARCRDRRDRCQGDKAGEHHSDHGGLRDGRPVADRQRMIGVGLGERVLRNERVAR